MSYQCRLFWVICQPTPNHLATVSDEEECHRQPEVTDPFAVPTECLFPWQQKDLELEREEMEREERRRRRREKRLKKRIKREAMAMRNQVAALESDATSATSNTEQVEKEVDETKCGDSAEAKHPETTAKPPDNQPESAPAEAPAEGEESGQVEEKTKNSEESDVVGGLEEVKPAAKRPSRPRSRRSSVVGVVNQLR